MILATQYYRPPFPLPQRWGSDFAEIRATGFDALVVSAPWSWIEPQAGNYVYDDFDHLMDMAAAADLKVIINFWAELQPLWIHRVYGDASMVDHLGRAVVSSQLAYAHFGIMPGCCTDHPQIRAAAADFIRAVVARYAAHPALMHWDGWNEMRWMAQADAYVCFCEHTLGRFRSWLQTSYGSIDSLNESLIRRYGSWQDVLPAKSPTRTYTDAMLWQRFIAERTRQDLRWRCDLIRAVDSKHLVATHSSVPSTFANGDFFEFEAPFTRGNDWQLSRIVDLFGCSHFPAWFEPSPLDYGARLESVRCAAGDRPHWISELQGGGAGHGMQAMAPVDASTQSRWIWNGVARGVKGISFWCWRDEVFGRESGGFGIVGQDGNAQERLQHLHRTAQIFQTHRQLLDQYQPDQARIGVVFEPLSYQLDWASFTKSGLSPNKESSDPAGHSVLGYLRALEQLQLPYDVIETSSLPVLDTYKFMVLPFPLVLDRRFADRLVEWVESGGTLLTEASLDAFDSTGLFRYASERPLAQRLGLFAAGRRQLDQRDLAYEIDGTRGTLPASRWLEPFYLDGRSEAPVCFTRHRQGSGEVVAIASFIGLAYWSTRNASFEAFVRLLAVRGGAEPSLTCSIKNGESLQWRSGTSGKRRLLFIINHGKQVSARWSASNFGFNSAKDLVTGHKIMIGFADGQATFDVKLDPAAYHVILFAEEATS